MKRSNKIIYWTSIAVICVFTIIPFLAKFVRLEISNQGFRNVFDQIRFFIFPVAILLTLFGTIKSKDTTDTKTIKIILTVGASLISVFILAMKMFAGMCEWTTNKILFRKVDDKMTLIVLRDFGCGATDSGLSLNKVCKTKNLFPSVIWVTEIDTSKIDRKVWQRVAGQE